MMAVKIIRCSASRLEGEINNFLTQLGSQPGFKVGLQDIKVTRIGGQNDIEEAMIIYSAVRLNQPSQPQQTQVRRPAYDPIHGNGPQQQ